MKCMVLGNTTAPLNTAQFITQEAIGLVSDCLNYRNKYGKSFNHWIYMQLAETNSIAHILKWNYDGTSRSVQQITDH